MNYTQTTKKLQKALLTKGIIYKINTYQFYSKEQHRFITGYRITEKQAYKKKNGEMFVKDVELLNTCSQVEVLKWFAEEWRKANMKRYRCKKPFKVRKYDATGKITNNYFDINQGDTFIFDATAYEMVGEIHLKAENNDHTVQIPQECLAEYFEEITGVK